MLRSKSRLLEICDALYLVKEAAARLSQATAFGDLTPARILIGNDGAVSLGKVGHMGQLEPATESAERLRYLAPERLSHQPADARSDLFSLGLILWRLLYGRDLFNDSLPADLIMKIGSHAHLQFPTSRKIDSGLKAVLSQMLAKNPEQRPSPKEAHRDLTKVLKKINPGYGAANWKQNLDALTGAGGADALDGILTGNREIDLAPLPTHQVSFRWQLWAFIFFAIFGGLVFRYRQDYGRGGMGTVMTAVRTDLRAALTRGKGVYEEIATRDYSKILNPQDIVTNEEGDGDSSLVEGQSDAQNGDQAASEQQEAVVSVLLNSVPAGARIYINQKPTQFVTPARLDLPARETSSLIFRLNGYLDCPALISTHVGQFTCRMQSRRR